MFFAVSLSIFLIAQTTGAIASEHKPLAIPTYSGFAEIQATKNCFLIVGDTQGTSHWEFWREKNDRKRRLVIDEITRRELAFVTTLAILQHGEVQINTGTNSMRCTKNFVRKRFRIFRPSEIMSFMAMRRKHFRIISGASLILTKDVDTASSGRM